MKNILLKFESAKRFEDVALFVLRFFLGATFMAYAYKKIIKFDWYSNWFSQTLELPLPMLNLYAVTLVEGLGGLLLILGLFTRAITIPLMVTMLVALFLVNIHNGFPASKFGMEVPLAYISILVVLFSTGAGRFSLDEKVLR